MSKKLNNKEDSYYLHNPKHIQQALSSFIGKKKGKYIYINWIEAFYLKEMKRYPFDIDFNFLKDNKVKMYFVYRDLRRRSLFPVFYEIKGNEKPIEVYKPTVAHYNFDEIKTYSLSKDGYVFIPFNFKDMYEFHWFGQRGLYKSSLKGELYLLDRFEAYYLYKKGFLSLSKEDVKKLTSSKNFEDYFNVYSSWRDLGFVVKTGFKFGADFRIYFPGTSPKNFNHSKHVLHVFPKGFNMSVEELSRAIRVANSVKKTFILAVPKTKTKVAFKPDFYSLNKNKKPAYAVKCFSQEDKISSKKLSSLLQETISLKLNLLFSISDRESSITYYLIKKISLPSSKYNFYEVKWINP